MEKFKITKNSPDSIVVSLRIDREVIKIIDDVSRKTDRSRNQIINMALKYALENMELEE